MKFSTYQQQVNPNTSNARVVAPTRPLVYNRYAGDGGKGLQHLAGALNNLAGIVQKKQDENDAADVAQARAEISQKLNQSIYGEQGILESGKGQNYSGLAGRVTDEVKETTLDVAKNYNGRVQKILEQKYLPDDLTSYGRMGLQHEAKERESYHATQYANGLSNIRTKMAMNYGDDELIEQGLAETEQTLASRGKEQGWDGAAFEAARTNEYSNIFRELMETSIANDDYDQAEKLLKRFKKHLSPDVYSKSYKVFNERRKNQENYFLGKDIAAQCFNNETGEIDYDKLQKMTEKAAGFSGGGFDYERAVNAGYEAFKDQTMPSHSNGCVEAVVRMGSWVNPWFKDKQAENNVDNLIAAAENDPNGPEVIPFEESKTEAGDVIVYADKNNVTQHVVMAAGGKSYVGNSSSNDKIVREDNYYQMDDLHPYLLIKTGGKNTSPKAGDMEKLNHIKQYVNAELGMMQKKRQEEHNKIIDGFEKRMLNGDYGGDLLNEIMCSGLDTREKTSLVGRIEAENKRRAAEARAAAGGGGSGGRTGAGAGGIKITQTDINNMKEADLIFTQGGSMTSSKWIGLDNAMEKYKQGWSDEEEEDYNALQQAYGWSDFTDDIEQLGVAETYNKMRYEFNASPAAALRMINAIHPKYKK